MSNLDQVTQPFARGRAHPELPEPRAVDERFIRYFRDKLRQENKSPRTIDIYVPAVRLLARWLAGRDLPTLDGLKKFDVRDYVLWMKDDARARNGEKFTEGYVSNQYRALQQFFLFMEQECDTPNPMKGMKAPAVHAPVVPVITEEQVTALLLSLRGGKSFEARRDYAILLLFLTTGMRLEELTNLTTEISLDEVFVITGKGRKQRLAAASPEVQFALHRYSIERAKHKMSHLPELWLAVKNRGPLTPNGIRQIIRRRAAQVGAKINPHKFRHTFAHRFKSAGGEDSDLMELMGWSSPQMVRRYGQSAAQERVVKIATRMMPDILPELHSTRKR